MFSINNLPPDKKTPKSINVHDEHGNLQYPPKISKDENDERTQRKRTAAERHKPGVVSLLVSCIVLNYYSNLKTKNSESM